MGEEINSRVIYEVEMEGFTDEQRLVQDIPEAYSVEKVPEACGGVVVYGRYRGGRWEANPNCRALVANLVAENTALNPDGIAEEVVSRLFTNGFGDKADRLVLEVNGKDRGGWCRGAVRDVVVDVISDRVRQVRKKDD